MAVARLRALRVFPGLTNGTDAQRLPFRRLQQSFRMWTGCIYGSNDSDVAPGQGRIEVLFQRMSTLEMASGEVPEHYERTVSPHGPLASFSQLDGRFGRRQQVILSLAVSGAHFMRRLRSRRVAVPWLTVSCVAIENCRGTGSKVRPSVDKTRRSSRRLVFASHDYSASGR